jgi:hypothetical protein
MNKRTYLVDPVKIKFLDIRSEKIQWNNLPNILKKSTSYSFSSLFKFGFSCLFTLALISTSAFLILFDDPTRDNIFNALGYVLFTLIMPSIYGYFSSISRVDNGEIFTFKNYINGFIKYYFEYAIIFFITLIIGLITYFIILDIGIYEKIDYTLNRNNVDDFGWALIYLVLGIAISLPVTMFPFFSIYLLFKGSNYQSEISLVSLIKSPFLACKKNFLLLLTLFIIFLCFSALLLFISKVFIILFFLIQMGLFFYLGEHIFRFEEKSLTI